MRGIYILYSVYPSFLFLCHVMMLGEFWETRSNKHILQENHFSLKVYLWFSEDACKCLCKPTHWRVLWVRCQGLAEELMSKPPPDVTRVCILHPWHIRIWKDGVNFELSMRPANVCRYFFWVPSLWTINECGNHKHVVSCDFYGKVFLMSPNPLRAKLVFWM